MSLVEKLVFTNAKKIFQLNDKYSSQQVFVAQSQNNLGVYNILLLSRRPILFKKGIYLPF